MVRSVTLTNYGNVGSLVNTVSAEWTRPMFLNRRAAARYRALASIVRAVRDSPGIDN